VGENREATFTEIKNAVQIEDPPSLSYHLNALGPLTVQKQVKYRLSELGRDTYNLMCKITAYSASTSINNSLKKALPTVIIANAILWATAILLASVFERSLQTTIFSLAILWITSNSILYLLSKRMGNNR